MALAAPVAAPDSTSRAPSAVVRIVAVTPGLSAALLMASAIPDRVLFEVSMLRALDLPPTAIVKVPVPNVGFAAEDRLAAVAKFCTVREYCAGIAAVVADAVAIVRSPMVAVRPARLTFVCSGISAACSVARALLKVPNAETWAVNELF